jgi:hypothetical protein
LATTLPPDNAADLLGTIRRLSTEYMAGTRQSFTSFRDLINLLLGLTIMKSDGAVRLFFLGGQEDKAMVAGWNPDDPVPLKNNRYLRIAITLQLVDVPEGHRLKVLDSSYQYQLDRKGDRWIFRYDYLRYPEALHPAAHFQVRGELTEASVLTKRRTLERVHFPTSRVSLESIIRLLVQEFGVKCNKPESVWRPALNESEETFMRIAHRP